MITLVGHGYIGNAVALELRKQKISFAWVRHTDRWQASGPIINAAGYIGFPNVDACEEKQEETIEGNVHWPLRCEKIAGDLPVVHISSGCVYMGGPFTEEDEPNFTGSFYSYSKVKQQEVLKRFMDKSYLLRMRMPFGLEDHPKNLITKFNQYKTLVNGLNSLSRTEDVARTAVFFAQNLPEYGIYNLVNPGFIENKEIADILGLEKNWVSQAEFLGTVKAPRSFCTLDSTKLQAVFPLDDVRTALHSIISETLPVEAVA